MIRQSTGVPGLNEMLGGGLPSGQTIVVIGPAGSGKTTLALQFIWDGLTKDELCMFLSLEENENKLIETASKYGWDFKKYLDAGTLSLIKLDALDITNTITHLKTDLPHIMDSTGVSRVAIDPFSIIEMAYENERERRVNIFDLCSTLNQTGATTMITSEIGSDMHSSVYKVIEHVVDGVILLHRIRESESRNVLHAIEVVKMIWTNHSKEIKPYDITPAGMNVHVRSKMY